MKAKAVKQTNGRYEVVRDDDYVLVKGLGKREAGEWVVAYNAIKPKAHKDHRFDEDGTPVAPSVAAARRKEQGMNKYTIQTYFNAGPGMFWGYERGDALVKGPKVTVEATSAAEALNVVWEAGNIGTQWSGGERRYRSLSVGDVLYLIEDDVAFSVASLGFGRVPGDALGESLAPDAKVRGREGLFTNGPFPPLPTDYEFDYDPTQTSL